MLLYGGGYERDTPQDLSLTIEIPFQNLAPGEEEYASKDVFLPESTFFTLLSPDVIGNAAILHHAVIRYPGKNAYCQNELAVLASAGPELTPARLGAYGVSWLKGQILLSLFILRMESRRLKMGCFVLSSLARLSAALPTASL